MKVCNVCLAPPTHAGIPVVKQTSTAGEVYLFGKDWSSGQMDLCSECLEAFQKGRWDTLAERAHDVLMLRLGLPSDT